MSRIGVFDSGVGGISVLAEIRRQVPDADLIYVADSGFSPYGDRPTDYVVERSIAIGGFLQQCRIDVCVVACNTATAVAIDTLRQRFSFPVIGIEPAVKPAASQTRSGVIGVLATTRTLSSARFEKLAAEHAAPARVLLQPCPGLAERVEQGDLESSETKALVGKYVTALIDEGADVLVLGCTHYTFLKPIVDSITAARVAILDPAPAVARQVVRVLRGLQTQQPSTGREEFWTTGDPRDVGPVIARLWGRRVDVKSVPDLTVLEASHPS